MRWNTPYVLFLIILASNGDAAKKRVCIVGAGLSGLIAAKYLSEYPDEFEPIVFEKDSDVGGMWIYTDSTTVDKHGLPVHSSIYKNLKTNGVKAMMTFPDYPDFGGVAGSGEFMKHEDVLQYLKNYTDHYKLRQHMRFNTNVVRVIPLPYLRWLIITKNLNTKQREEFSCDAAIICNGFNVKGYVPEIAGIESFTGRVLHSHVYRKPEVFTNQTVVVLGASYSGVDIGIDVSSTAKKIYLSHRHDKLPPAFPPNLEQVPGVVKANGSKLILSNGTKLRADALIFCTGYVYDFPFFDKNSGIVVDSGKYIRSIYKHMINIERPTMAIIDVPEPAYHFENPHAQMLYFRAVLRGKLSLPSRRQMLMEAQLPANVTKSKAHFLPNNMTIPYFNELAVAAGGKPLPWWFESANEKLGKITAEDPVHFKDKRLVIREDERRVEFV